MPHIREAFAEHIRVLFDRFHFVDMVVKLVGVGSVGTMCGVGLFLAADNGPLFLQENEAHASVMVSLRRKSLHSNRCQRVIIGQRLMQASSDVFLGWTRGRSGRPFYICQFARYEAVAGHRGLTGMLRQYGRMCAHALARAHARSGDAAMPAGHMVQDKRLSR
ncbi:DUF2252 family protein [Cupriavidus necator]